MEYLILINLKKVEQEWEVKPQDIKNLVEIPDGINILCKNNVNK